MKCKFCNEELPEKGYFCPICGGDQRDAEQDGMEELILKAQSDELIDLPEEEIPEAKTDEKPEKEADASANALTKAKRLATITGCIAALAILATVLFLGIRGGWDVKSWFDWQIFRENTISYKDSYSVDDKKADKKSDVVVATLGDAQLTNGQLQIYYWYAVFDFYSNYYNYLSYLGVDFTKPLDEQMYTENQSWQQYFLQTAIQNWQANQALSDMAKAKGFQLPEDVQKELDEQVSSIEERALKGGYASALEMVQESFGPGATVEDYIAYLELYYNAYAYFGLEYEKIQPTDQQIEEYFAANEEALKSQGISKDSGNNVDVRHILVLIEKIADETEEEIANKEPSQRQWDACLAEAQKLLDLWLENPTEDYFAELANTHSHDQGGKVTNGGIYENITKETNFVKPFLDWCMDDSRQVGDYEIVKTEYGYHIMYFSHTEPKWFVDTRDAFISAESQKIVNEALDANEVEINFKKIVLGVVNF